MFEGGILGSREALDSARTTEAFLYLSESRRNAHQQRASDPMVHGPHTLSGNLFL